MTRQEYWMFGKQYYGRRMDKVPSSYLKWASENLKIDKFATIADEEWQWREKYNEHVEDDE